MSENKGSRATVLEAASAMGHAPAAAPNAAPIGDELKAW
jgi:hypothetical protein